MGWLVAQDAVYVEGLQKPMLRHDPGSVVNGRPPPFWTTVEKIIYTKPLLMGI